MLEAACMLSVCGMQGELPQVGKQVYRQLLKSIDRHITSIANNKQWRNYVAAKFRQGREVADPQIIAARIQLADDYTFLINNIAHHQVCACQSCFWVASHATVIACVLFQPRNL
jgi:hypothetical protein